MVNKPAKSSIFSPENINQMLFVTERFPAAEEAINLVIKQIDDENLKEKVEAIIDEVNSKSN